MTKNILIAGVGGQGTLLASKVMGKVFLDSGYDVKVSEVHGMSQRGGSVITYVRYGEKVFSPIIDKGEGDLLIAFEQLEAARWLPFLKIGGTVISNTQKINPMPVIMGNAVYPQKIAEKMRGLGVKMVTLVARALAEEAGSPWGANMALLGAAAAFLGFEKEIWQAAIQACVPPKTALSNLKAFDLGYLVKEGDLA